MAPVYGGQSSGCVCLSRHQQWLYLGKMTLFLQKSQHAFVFQCFYLSLDFRLSVHNTVPSQYHLTTGSGDKTSFLPQVQRKYWKFPLFLNFHGEKKSLEIDKDELLREEEESNPKEYSKLHCLNLHFLDMKNQKKPH